MKVAVVILNWNGYNYLKKFLPLVVQHTQSDDCRVIVADNASTDDSIELLNVEFPEVQVISLSKNYGFAEGYNRALAQIDAEYFVLLNSDVETTENWLEPMLEYMDTHPEVAACQPKIRAYNNRSKFEHAGAAGGYIDKFGFPFCRGRVFGNVETDNGQYDTVAEIFWATGACMLTRSETFRKVGGFDADFFAHMEEIDLCWRFNARGLKVVCVPQSIVYHVGGGTLSTESPYKTYLNFRNNLLMLYKNLPQNLLVETLEARFFFDYAAALQMLLTGKFSNAYAVYKARRDFALMQNRFADKRNENIRFSTCQSCPTIYSRSIVVEFYLKRRKTFARLMALLVK